MNLKISKQSLQLIDLLLKEMKEKMALKFTLIGLGIW